MPAIPSAPCVTVQVFTMQTVAFSPAWALLKPKVSSWSANPCDSYWFCAAPQSDHFVFLFHSLTIILRYNAFRNGQIGYKSLASTRKKIVFLCSILFNQLNQIFKNRNFYEIDHSSHDFHFASITGLLRIKRRTPLGIVIKPDGPEFDACTLYNGFNDCIMSTNGELFVIGMIRTHDYLADVGANLGEWSLNAFARQPNIFSCCF